MQDCCRIEDDTFGLNGGEGVAATNGHRQCPDKLEQLSPGWLVLPAHDTKS